MRVLITGGAGCLGANIVDHWRARGHNYLVIDNLATAIPDALAGARQLEFLEGDVGDRALVEHAVDRFRPDVIIHAAAAYKDPSDWRGDLMTNTVGTVNLVEAAKRSRTQRFINFQTALCYGRPDRTPVPVDAPLRPFTSYGISKTAGEQYLAMSGLNFVSLRIANVTGPRLSIGPIPTFYERLKAGKRCFCSDTTRDFLDMEDFLCLLDLVVKETTVQGVFNAASGEGHTIKEVFDQVAAYLGVTGIESPPILPAAADDVPIVVLDPTETTRAFGWRARVSFNESIQRMLAWYDANGVRTTSSHLKAPG